MARQVQSPALTMRILKYCFLASALMFIYIVIEIPAQPGAPPNHAFEYAISFIGLIDILLGFYLPRLLLRAAEGKGKNDAAANPVNRWRSGCVLSLAFFESSILFGLVLHFLGARLQFVELLIGAGIVAMLFWSPGEPPGTREGGEFPQG